MTHEPHTRRSQGWLSHNPDDSASILLVGPKHRLTAMFRAFSRLTRGDPDRDPRKLPSMGRERPLGVAEKAASRVAKGRASRGHPFAPARLDIRDYKADSRK